MTRKQWAILTMTLLLSAFSLIVGAVVLIDPFEVYHKATAFIPPITNSTQNYSNAGIAKSYEYDSVVIGSSMTENFLPSQLDSLFGGQFVKLSINGGSPYNHKQMMDLAFGAQDIQRVIYGLDIELMTYFYTTPKCEMPDYLYDDNLFNDVSYWFNKSVLARYIPRCLSTLGQTDENQRDTMYTWGHLYTYGADVVLSRHTFSSKKVDQTDRSSPVALAQAYKLNVEHNLLPYLQAHPDTEFIFFFPPYSLVQWYEFYAEGHLGYYLGQKEAVTQELLRYDNAKVFDFQAQSEWITNLDHYIDASHYGPWINEQMAEFMAADVGRVTDVSAVRENNDLIERLVAQIVERGAWPDSFDL